MYREYWLRLIHINHSLIRYIFISCLIIGQLYASHPVIDADKIKLLAKQYQGQTQKRFFAWYKIITESKSLTTREKLEKANQFFNFFEYQSDSEFQGTADYWKSPIEFVVDMGGDCEDFAIAKYFTLVAMGVNPDELRITYVKSLKLNQAHMVLAWYSTPDAEPLILDNLDAKIQPASKRPDLIPVYSFNADGMWLVRRSGPDRSVGGSNRLSKWQRVLDKINHDGDKK